MSTQAPSHLIQGQPNQYHLSKIDSASAFNSATSTLISSNEMISQSSANSSCGYSMSGSNSTAVGYLGLATNETNMFHNSPNETTFLSNNLTSGQLSSVAESDSAFKKKKKKKNKHRERSNHEWASSAQQSVSSGAVNTVQFPAPGTHYPVRHYVQQTESVIISTRKLSVVESVQCPPNSGNLDPSSCNIANYHPGAPFGSQPSKTDFAVSHQSAAISTLFNQATSSSASSLTLHSQNEIATRAHQEGRSSGQASKKRHKKKGKHWKEGANIPTEHFSSQGATFPSNLPFALGRGDGGPLRETNCDLAKCVSSSSSANTSRSHSLSSCSSASDSESALRNPSNPYDSYRRKKKEGKLRPARTQPNASFSSTSPTSDSSSSASDYSASEDEEVKSVEGSSSVNPSRSTSCSKSNNSLHQASNDILKQISMKDQLGIEADNFFAGESTITVTKYGSSTSEPLKQISTGPLQVSTSDGIALQKHSFSPSFNASFSMENLLQQEETQASQVEGISRAPTTQSAPSPLNPALMSLSKQNTPLSSAVLSDDCNSVESPLSVESSGRDSGKDESKMTVKRRDPAEERQRLRSYRIPHHLSQSRSTLPRSSDSATSVTSSAAPASTSSISSGTSLTTSVVSSTTAATTAVTTKGATAKTSPASVSTSVASTEAQSKPGNSLTHPKKDANKSVSRAVIFQSESRSSAATGKKPVAIVSSNATKVAASPVLAPNQPSGSHFLNPSFFVPGATSSFPYSQHYPFSPAAFMPALFPNQFLSSPVNAAKSVAASSSQARFLHPQAQSQASQLTIFTSPTLSSNAATAHALSPFPFPGLGSMSHPALLSPTFSPSSLGGNATGGSLLVPKSLNFSPNFSFPPGTGIDPLLMFGITNSKPITAATSTSSSGSHHTPPFILPRLVSTSTATSASLTPTVTKSIGSRSKQADKSKQAVLKPSLLLTNTSSCTISNNTQHSPLSTTILHPQTLLLFPPQPQAPIASPFVGKSAVSSSTTQASAICSAADRLASLGGTSSSMRAVVSSTGAVVSGASLSAPLSKLTMPTVTVSSSAPSLQPSPLGSFIFSPNSSHSHLPYALFSPPHPHTLMQPISIQAPPQPSPSSLLGTQLLLSVISPTHRNPLGPTLTSPLNAPVPQVTSPQVKSSQAEKQETSNSMPAVSTFKSKDLSLSSAKCSSKEVAAASKGHPTTSLVTPSDSLSKAPIITSAYSLASSQCQTAGATSSTLAGKSAKSTFSTVNESHFKDSRASVYGSIGGCGSLPRTLSSSTSSSKVIRDSRVPPIPAHLSSMSSSGKSSQHYPYLLPKCTPKDTLSVTVKRDPSIKSPELSHTTVTSPNNPPVDEFESLVRSVKDKIKTFQTSSDFYDEQVSPRKETEKNDRPTNDPFNSRKMLSLMIYEDETVKEQTTKRGAAKWKAGSSTAKSTKTEMDDANERREPPGKCTTLALAPKELLEESNEKKPLVDGRVVEMSKLPFEKLCTLPEEGRKEKEKEKEPERDRDRRKGKGIVVACGELSRLEKRSTSRAHKSHSKSRRSRGKHSLLRDPVLVAHIESLIPQLARLRISPTLHLSFPAANSGGVLSLPPMFRFSPPKTVQSCTVATSTSKAFNRSGRSSGLRGRLSPGMQSTSSQCPLPLKKRQHRNPEETNYSQPKLHTSSPHNSSALSKSENQGQPMAGGSRTKHHAKAEETSTSRPESSLSQNSSKSSSKSKSKKTSTKTTGQPDTCEPTTVNNDTRPSGESSFPKTGYPGGGEASHLAVGPGALCQRGPHLRAPAVAPPVERSGKPVAVSAANRQLPQPHVATTRETCTLRVEAREKSRQPQKTVSSEHSLQPPPPTTHSAAVLTSGAQPVSDTVQGKFDASPTPAKGQRGRKKTPDKEAITIRHPGAKSSLASTSISVTSLPYKGASKSPTHVTNGSSLDESSDADDEFDSDDEVLLPAQLPYKLTEPSTALLSKKKPSVAQKSIHLVRESSEMAKLPVSAKPAKPVRLNGVHKSVGEKVKVQSSNRQHAVAVAKHSKTKASINGDMKKRASKETFTATDSGQGKHNNISKGDCNGNSAKNPPAKRKKRRPNKTGFVVPRKRSKPAASSKEIAKPISPKVAPSTVPSKGKTMPPQSNGLNGYSSQSDKANKKGSKAVAQKKMSPKKKKSKPISSASSDASSTEIDDELPFQRKKKTKTTPVKAKVTKRSHKKSPKVPSFDSSDSDQRLGTIKSATSSSASSQDEEEESVSKKISLCSNDYPIYMVTKPSASAVKTHSKKVYPIKSNPFIRPIPSKKYYKVSLHAKEFGILYPNEYESFLVNRRNLVKAGNLNEEEMACEKSPILPLAECVTSNELSSPSASSSSLSSQDEGDGPVVKPKRRVKRLNMESKDLKEQILKPITFNAGYSLPFDIWYQYKFNPLPSAMSSANYRRVKQNVFADMKPIAEDSHQVCTCPQPKGCAVGCGSDCMNRMMYQECWTQSCPTGKSCSNQRIQKYEWSPGLERFMTSQRGWGIRTTEAIKSGEFILEYIGEIVSDQLFKKRMTERYGNDQHHYSLKIDSGMVIDGYRVANEGRFVNHSCEPNCEMQKWAVNGYYRICMFALRDIKPDEELFYDYKFQNFNIDSQQTCHCGSEKCRGFISGKRANTTLAEIASTSSTDGQQFSNENSKDSASSDKLKNGKNTALFSETSEKAQPVVKKKPIAEDDELNWLLVNMKNDKLTMLRSQYETICKSSKSLTSGGRSRKQVEPVKNEQSVDLLYDPYLLKALSKTKPLNHKERNKVAEKQIFLLRNYRNVRHFYMGIWKAAEASGKGKASLDLNQNPYAKHKATSYRSGSSSCGNSSESDTNDGHNGQRRKGARLDDRLLDSEDNGQIVLKMVEQVKIISEICAKTAAFFQANLATLLSNVNGKDLPESANGQACLLNGGMKRDLKQLNDSRGFNDVLINFKSIFEKIQSRQFTEMSQFVTEMKAYIYRILKTDLDGGIVPSKRQKLSLGANGDKLANHTSDENISLHLLLKGDQIKALIESTCAFLDNLISQKKWLIEEIFQHAYNGDLKDSLLNISALNKLKNDNLTLGEISQKMEIFYTRIHQIELTTVFDGNGSSNGPFDLIADIAGQSLKVEEGTVISKAAECSILPTLGSKPNEEVIRCICGHFREEGEMIQCERCEIWQHSECVGQFVTIDRSEKYLCEVCQPRKVPLDIPLCKKSWPKDDYGGLLKYYLSLELPFQGKHSGKQIKMNDCVLIYRQANGSALPMKNMPPGKKNDKSEVNFQHVLDTLKIAASETVRKQNRPFERRECIMLRVQYLAIAESTNQRILYGHHYLWPSETYHEPTRKFYENEVLRSPISEWAALEEVHSTCAVLDPATFGKGRPRAFKPEDVYICEFRVDRPAKAFSRIPKAGHYPVNMKNFAFEMFDEKLTIKRTYSPHNIPDTFVNKKLKTSKKDKKEDDKTDAQAAKKTNKAKMDRLLKITNQLSEGAYFWYLLLEQEQSKLKETAFKADLLLQ